MTTQATCQQCGRDVVAGAKFCANCGTNVSDAQGEVATKMMPRGGATAEMRDLLLERLRDATLGEYEILTELGRGGMATVYLGHDLQLDRKVAVKVMLPELLEGEGMIDRFKLEARTAAQLSHPHIIPIYAVRDDEHLLFFIMKFIEGRALDSIIEELGKLPITMATSILAKVGEALGYAHRRGVVHRDIKPANLMIDVEGLPIVTDFGIAKVADTRGLTMTGATIGTPTYMSPEQCAAGTITGASDQYSLGVVAYQMIAGRLPFQGDNVVGLLYQHCHEPPPPFMDARPDCPPALHDAVMKMLAKKPADRFPSLEAAVQAIGGGSLAFDDPIRMQLVDLAKTGGNLAILKRISTPRSPTPLRSKVTKRGAATAQAARTAAQATEVVSGGTQAPAVSPTATLVAAPDRKLRWSMFVVATVIIGVTLWQRPWEPRVPPVVATAAASLVVQPTSGVLDIGGTLQLAAAVQDSAGQPMSVSVAWTSSDPNIATVTPTGLVRALASGAARIQASAGGLQSATQVTVSEVAAAPPPPVGSASATVARIRVDGAPPSLSVGGSAQLRAIPLDERGASVPGKTIGWSSSDASVATVTPGGLVGAASPGSVTLTARSGTVTQTVTLQVLALTAASVSLSPVPGPLTVGATTRLSALVRSADGRQLNSAVSWRSGDARVATVSDGLVTAVGAGSTTITASADGRDASTPVTVVAAVAVRPPTPESTPAVTPPPAAADPRDAIAAMIQDYARALESKQVAQVRRIYPDIASGQLQTLQSLERLRVRLRVSSIDVQGDNATASVSGEYEFYSPENRRTENLPVRFQASLENGANGWRIRSLTNR